jgi:peptidoglycan/LPS O-acetylase OafA/YrhL
MLRYVTLTLSAIAVVTYFVVFGRMGENTAMFFFTFTMIPYFLIALFAMIWRSLGSQIVCLFTTIAYSAWFTLLYLNVAIWHPDPQSPIAFLFVSIYAAPVLFVLWLVAYAFEWNYRSHENPQ